MWLEISRFIGKIARDEEKVAYEDEKNHLRRPPSPRSDWSKHFSAAAASVTQHKAHGAALNGHFYPFLALSSEAKVWWSVFGVFPGVCVFWIGVSSWILVPPGPMRTEPAGFRWCSGRSSPGWAEGTSPAR